MLTEGPFDMDALRLSRYVTWLRNDRDPGQARYGLTHRLTGETFGVSPDLRLLTAGQGVPKAGSEALPGDLASVVDVLRRHRFLVDEAESDSLVPFLDHVVRPVRLNPAISYRDEADRRVLVRLDCLDVCRTPMPKMPPAIVEEVVPQAVARVLEMADSWCPLRHVLEASMRDPLPLGEQIRGGEAALDWLTDPLRQLVKLSPPGYLADVPYLPQDLLAQSFTGPADHQWAGPALDYYSSPITDTDRLFDWVEPTVSHAFRFGSSALGGLPYAARFYRAVRRHLVPGWRGLTEVLEIGGGLGYFARDFIGEAERAWDIRDGQLSYQILEVAPSLRERQKLLLKRASIRVEVLAGEAQALDLPGRTFDLVIANEVLADFGHAAAARGGDEAGGWSGPGAKLIADYGLSMAGAPSPCLLNQGAIRFVERLWSHLREGGAAFLTEYGGRDLFPTPTEHLDHPEYSIHFGHLERCARVIGFETRIIGLAEFIGCDDRSLMLAGGSEKIHCLNRALMRSKRELPFAAFSKQDFLAGFGDLASDLQLTGLSYCPLHWGYHFGPSPGQFWVLILTKPASSTPP
jgi:hypothetical protein